MPRPPAERFTPTGLSSVWVKKTSIACMWGSDQYSPGRRRAGRGNAGAVTQSEARLGTENGAAPFRLSSPHRGSPNESECTSDPGLRFVWVPPLFFPSESQGNNSEKNPVLLVSVTSDYASAPGSQPIIRGWCPRSRKQKLEAFRSLTDLLNAAHRLLLPFF